MYSSLDTMKYTKSNAGAMKMRSWARRRFLKYFCFLLLLTLLPLIYYRKAILLTLRRHHYLFQYQTPDLDEPKHIPLMNVSDADLTIRNSSVHEVLLWNPFFGDSLYVKPLNSSVCPQIKCMFTADRNRFDSANAIIFHLPDFKGNDLPRYKPANQIWILLCQESPSNYQYRTILSSFNNHIDLVATYRYMQFFKIRFGNRN